MGQSESSAQEADNCNCRILVIGKKTGDDALSELSNLPSTAKIVATGCSLAELREEGYEFTEANVMLVTGHYDKDILGPIIGEMPFLSWIHTLSAGVETLMIPQIVDNPDITLTNAKGMYKYVMGAVSYFTKDFRRLDLQKDRHEWNRFPMREIRGMTMGIVGYGDIGRSCAVLANAYGMNVVGLKRTLTSNNNNNNASGSGSGGSPIVDPLLTKLYDKAGLEELMNTSDVVVCCLPLTPETTNFIDAAAIAKAKPGQILINIGRGPVINEDAMIAALESGLISGAALDVFNMEPLPSDHKLWSLPNLLFSPHNADYTDNFRHKSVKYFCENCIKVIANEALNCVVNKQLGY